MGENKSIQILIGILRKRTQSRTHLFVTLNLGVDKGPQNVRCERQVDVDELCLLMQAVQREVIPQLHGYDRVFLLKEEELSDQEEGGRTEKQEKTAFLPIPEIQTQIRLIQQKFPFSIMQTAACHSSCTGRAAREPVTSAEENHQWVAQISQSTGYPFQPKTFLQM